MKHETSKNTNISHYRLQNLYKIETTYLRIPLIHTQTQTHTHRHKRTHTHTHTHKLTHTTQRHTKHTPAYYITLQIYVSNMNEKGIIQRQKIYIIFPSFAEKKIYFPPKYIF